MQMSFVIVLNDIYALASADHPREDKMIYELKIKIDELVVRMNSLRGYL